VYDTPDPAAVARVDVRSGDRHGAESRSLEALVHDWSDIFPSVAVETSFTHGQPARVLIDAATDADLLMIARHQRDLRHLVRLGPTLRAVLGASDVPVEVVPLTGAPTPMPLVLERSGTILKD